MNDVDAYLRRARELLERGTRVADALGYYSAAGRDAYMAAFHAAQAVIHSRTGRVAKTHRGVRSELSRIAREDGRVESDFAAFLANGYRLKEQDDYEVDPDAPITRAAAYAALTTAARLVAHAEWLLAQPPA